MYEITAISLVKIVVTAFNKVKALLANATKLSHILAYHELCLTVDASSESIELVLQQGIYNVWKPIAFFSKS